LADNRNAPGLIEAVIYFENAKGRIIVSPDTSHPCPQGYERREARTLAEVDRLTRHVNQQDQSAWDDLCAKDRAMMQERRDRVRSKLRQRMLASDCTAFERRFIQGALEYLQKKEDDLYRANVRGYFHQREFGSNDVQLPEPKSLVPKMSDRLANLLTR